jgi:hypothetical protein
MGEAYNANGEEKECIWVIGGKVTTMKTKTSGWIILSWILERDDEGVLTGLVWLRKGTSGELL